MTRTGTWTDGKLTKTEAGQSYVISLTVTDLQGAQSSVTKYIGAGLPVADFSFASDVISKYSTLQIVDNSYEPSNLALTNYYWKLIGPSGTVVWSTNGNATSYLKSFTSYPTGKYKYSLVVTNSVGKTSEEFSRSFTVVPDTISPSITIDVPSSEWSNSAKANYYFADSDSGFSYYRYYVDNLQTMNNSKLGSNITAASGDIAFGPTGTYANGQWFLHLYVADKAGNVATQTYGPYRIDNQKPTLNVTVSDFPVDEGTVDSIGITIKGLQGWKFKPIATDPKDSNNAEGSGIAGYTITKTTTKPDKSSFMNTGSFLIRRSGTYYFWAIDKTGNISDYKMVSVQPDITFTKSETSYKVPNIIYNGENVESVIYNHTMLRL